MSKDKVLRRYQVRVEAGRKEETTNFLTSPAGVGQGMLCQCEDLLQHSTNMEQLKTAPTFLFYAFLKLMHPRYLTYWHLPPPTTSVTVVTTWYRDYPSAFLCPHQNLSAWKTEPSCFFSLCVCLSVSLYLLFFVIFIEV